MQCYGYAGKIIYVDLTSGQTRTEPLDMEMAKKFIGGWGIGERLLYNLLKPGTDPLSPDNPIIIGAGPLVGTRAPSTSKIQLLTKSATPAHKEQSRYYIGPSSGGSNRFGLMMKKAGYDQIVITGRASKPVYLKIIDDDVELCSADDLWGKKDVYETSDKLMRRHKGSGVITIGKGGENQVVFAVAFVDKRDTIGRNGGAAVMGSKNLKAIVVHGTKEVKVWDSKELIRLSERITMEAVKHTPFLNQILPAMNLPSAALPPEVELTEMRTCSSCPTPCRTVYKVKTGEFAGAELRSGYWILVPRYTQYMELKDYTHMMKLIEVFNRTGICFVTSLAMIKFVTALYKRGVVSRKETGGLELKMGDLHSYLKLAEKIANREDIGDTMAHGWYAIAARTGVDEDTYENSRGIVKGTSVIPGAENRRLGLLFESIVNPRGGMHLHPLAYFLDEPMDKFKEWCRDLAMSQEDIDRIFTSDDFDCGRFTRHYEDGEAIYWSLGLCVFGVMLGYQSLRLLADLYSYATGIQTTPEELKKAGERIWNLCKLLNAREGFTRVDDRCPGLWARSMDKPIKEFILGELQLTDYFGRPIKQAGLEQMLDNYYDEHGWDVKTGIPTREKLVELELDEFADLLTDS